MHLGLEKGRKPPLSKNILALGARKRPETANESRSVTSYSADSLSVISAALNRANLGASGRILVWFSPFAVHSRRLWPASDNEALIGLPANCGFTTSLFRLSPRTLTIVGRLSEQRHRYLVHLPYKSHSGTRVCCTLLHTLTEGSVVLK